MEQSTALRRKTAIFKGEDKSPPTAARAFSTALMRAERIFPGLVIEVVKRQERRLSLAELLEIVETPAFLSILAGPQETLGIAVMSTGLTAALIESRMTGRIAAAEPAPRRTTPTDAMLGSRFLDAVLDDASATLATEADVTWAGGYRYASYLDDPRPLGLMMDEGSYRILSFDLSWSGGARTGRILFALPAAGRGAAPVPKEEPLPVARLRPNWEEELGQTVSASPVRLDAVLGRVALPLSAVTGLAPGMIISLPGATIDRIALQGLDGRVVGEGRLGQSQGSRAIRLTSLAEEPEG